MNKDNNNEPKITRERMIELLNEDLAGEYQAIIAYVVYSQVLKGAAYTDIAKDGMMSGPNFEALAEMQSAVKLPIIAHQKCFAALEPAGDLWGLSADAPLMLFGQTYSIPGYLFWAGLFLPANTPQSLLEPNARKRARPVLKGAERREAPGLPDTSIDVPPSGGVAVATPEIDS